MEEILFPHNPIDCKNFIHGELVAGQGESHEIHSPYTGKLLGHCAQSTHADVEAAIKSAQSAQKTWAQISVRERAQIFLKFREWLLANIDMLSHSISAEGGKLLKEARDELLKGVEITEYAAGLLHHDTLAKAFVSKGISCEYRREALGVVVGITPSNFPSMVPMWMIPIAIMTGNSFILKPSERTPLTPMLLAHALKECGLPNGVFNIVHGDKNTVDLLCTHPDVQAIGFVGSTPAARAVYQKATLSNKRAVCLGGAKNHIFLMPDAKSDVAVEGIVASFTGCAGQRCMAASVLLAVGDVEHIIEQIVMKAQSIKLGSEMGALLTKASQERLTKAIAQAQQEGAKLLLDGRLAPVPEQFKNGNWLGPTLIDGVSTSSQAACDELFGPILAIIRCKNISEAMEIENANPFGNAASVFTSSAEVAEYVAQHARAGMIGTNIGVPVPREPFSFGGLYDSKFGHGDITGSGAIEFWSNRKKITQKWSLQSDKSWMS